MPIEGPTNGPNGLIIPVRIGMSLGQQMTMNHHGVPMDIDIEGYLDTGADVIVLDSRYVLQLNLDPRGYSKATIATHITFTAVYAVKIELDLDGVPIVVGNARCVSAPSLKRDLGFDALLGKPLLERLVLQFHGPNETFSIWNP